MEDNEPTPQDLRQAIRHHNQITAKIAKIGLVLPGSIVERYTRCGKHNCRCHADPPQLHGPYTLWTRKIAGKTVTQTLTADEAARYQPWIDNARALRALAHDLETIATNLASRHRAK